MDYTKENLKKVFDEKKPLLSRTINNVEEALKIFLKESNIPYLTITSRLKEFDSFYEKIDRKNYSSPFVQTEDLCGIRIILYYQSDIDKVNEIINREFEVQENEDKKNRLDVNEFGYRSHHFIIKIKERWLDTPNYRGLEGIKVEIQVRTVLMHAWAEIEHKLGYKNKDQVPKELKRKLYRISAKLEEADEQFQELDNQIGNYKDRLVKEAVQKGKFTFEEFNLNTLQALMDFYFPDHEKHSNMTFDLFKEIKELNIEPIQLIEYAEKIKPLVSLIDKQLFGDISERKTTQPNILGYAIQAFHPSYNRRKASKPRLKLIEEIEKLKKV